MKYLDKACTRCDEKTVIPPLKKELGRQPILVKCDSCGKFSRFKVIRKNDNSTSYELRLWGNRKNPRKTKRVVRAIDVRHLGLSSEEINSRLDTKTE